MTADIVAAFPKVTLLKKMNHFQPTRILRRVERLIFLHFQIQFQRFKR